MTTIYKQLTSSDKKRVLRAVLSRVMSRRPASRKLLLGILKLVQNKQASKQSSWQALETHVGRHIVIQCATLALEDIEAQLMKERDNPNIHANTLLCYGCMSFRAQLKCARCQNVCLCIGCAGYGKCGQCEDDGDD